MKNAQEFRKMDADPHHEEANLEMQHFGLEEKDQSHQQSKS